MSPAPDHGGGLDAAIARYGGRRDAWLDLSTGVNPHPFPTGRISRDAWAALPDRSAQAELLQAARTFWQVPPAAAIVAAPGASSLIARIPTLAEPAGVDIAAPTYNEHLAAFKGNGWRPDTDRPAARVAVHPNNPDGRLWTEPEITGGTPRLLVIDESFCDVAPEQSHIALAERPGVLVLKSFGKFWGLAGLRLGFAIGDPALVAALASALGPWPVSGPALRIGRQALRDTGWADATRTRLRTDAARLDQMMTGAGASLQGGTALFRLYQTDGARDWQEKLASRRIWSRIFPYSETWIRLGLPGPNRWSRLEAAL